ncbi:hypothetical protein Tco_1156467 [Tanacetum coccineum]
MEFGSQRHGCYGLYITFQELALLCPRMVPEEEDKVERYICGLPESIQGNMTLARTTRLQDTNIARAYTAGPGEKKEYAGTLPWGINENIIILDHALQSAEIQWHYRSECPELKNQNRGNQAGNSEARGRVYALGGGEAGQDPSNITDNIDA